MFKELLFCCEVLFLMHIGILAGWKGEPLDVFHIVLAHLQDHLLYRLVESFFL